MRNFNYLFIVIASTFFIKGASAQNIGINNTGAIPDPSTLLDIDASPGNDKGLLIPRIALVATNSALPVTAPAISLLVYNTATTGAAPNNVLPGYYYWNGTIWIAFKTEEDSYNSIDATASITTTSTADVQVAGMTLTPGAGTYVVNFNTQCDIPDATLTTGLNTADLKVDLNLIYTDIINIPVTNTTHPLTFGGGEVLNPGVYSLLGAMSIAGSLTLDGGGDPNALFIIRGTAALATGAGTIVTLINGASPENIYWVAQGAIGIAASTTIQGTLFSNTAAVAVGASCTIIGRLLTKIGAVTFGPGTISTPINPSFIDLRRLASFVLFSGSGGLGNTGTSTYTGNIGTDLGAITGFGDATILNGVIFDPGATAILTPIYHEATFSLYQNGVLIPNSSRTRIPSSAPSDIYLHGIAAVLTGETIEVRWKLDGQVSDTAGQVSVRNRILSLTKVK